METDRLTLPDGRTLAFDEYGDGAGRPVLNCHGGLLCRTDTAPADAAARELGLRIISPDRPGVGGSDRRPMAATSEWVADVSTLVDHLGLDRFAVMGWSLGGQYALAVGAALPERVTKVAVLAGCVPLDDRARFAELNPLDRTLARLSLHAPPAARAAFAALRSAARRAPVAMARNMVRHSIPAEADAVLAESRFLSDTMVEGLRQLHGAVDEYRTYVAPWGFALEDVEVDVELYQGTVDDLVPAAWAEQLEAGLPRAELHVFEGEGHMIGLTRRADVLAAL